MIGGKRLDAHKPQQGSEPRQWNAEHENRLQQTITDPPWVEKLPATTRNMWNDLVRFKSRSLISIGVLLLLPLYTRAAQILGLHGAGRIF